MPLLLCLQVTLLHCCIGVAKMSVRLLELVDELPLRLALRGELGAHLAHVGHQLLQRCRLVCALALLAVVGAEPVLHRTARRCSALWYARELSHGQQCAAELLGAFHHHAQPLLQCGDRRVVLLLPLRELCLQILRPSHVGGRLHARGLELLLSLELLLLQLLTRRLCDSVGGVQPRAVRAPQTDHIPWSNATVPTVLM